MATRKKAIEKAVSPLDQPERFRLGEVGSLGLSIFNGVTQDELKRELNWPNSINTFREMSYHSAINAPLTLFENIISKANWIYKPPENATEEEKSQAKIINQMMQDMDQSWSEFVRDVLSSNVFGFSVHEKVYCKRFKANGSLYDDGVIGWKKLPIRVQESISKFLFSDDGNDITGVQQSISSSNDIYKRFSKRSNLINIPRSKFLLFRTGKHRGDPFGKSPLRDAYLAWRFLTQLEELEALGVAKDLNGIPVLSLPPQVLAADGDQEQRLYFENAIRNLQVGEQMGIILPSLYDEQGKPLYDIKLLSSDGKKNFDLNKIKEYYRSLIFISLFADILLQGNTSTGSFALGAIKNSLSGAYAERLISNIAEVIQNDLIRQTYELNSWSTERMGKLDFDGLDNTDIESLSKYLQRVASVGLLEKDRAVLNAVRQGIGIDPLPEDLPPQQDLLTPETSRAGDGMTSPGEGTSTDVSGQDTSSNNLENAA
ncbi:MAG: hypothetical protein ABFD50_07225 [Smithella sp.]